MFRKIWTPEMVIEQILASNGKEPLNSYYYATHYPRVYAAAERMFGSWGKAIYAAGLDYTKIRKYRVWSKSRVVEDIRGKQQIGESLTCKHAQQDCRPLYLAAVHRFKSWKNAVHAAGIDYTQIRLRRSMSERQIKEEILRLYKAGEDLSYSNMRKNYQYLLAYGMKKLGGGSWANARRACGITENFRIPKTKRLRKAE